MKVELLQLPNNWLENKDWSPFDSGIKTSIAGIRADGDADSGRIYARLAIYLVNPKYGEETYMEYSEEDTKKVVFKENDKFWILKEDLDYLMQGWEIQQYHEWLYDSGIVQAERGDGNISDEVWDAGKADGVPVTTKLYDDVFSNKELIKQDWNISLPRAIELKAKVNEIFPDDQDWNSNKYNIMGEYVGDSIRPPYKSTNSVTFYHMYQLPSKELLEQYKVPDVGYDYKFWHAIKYDLDNKVKRLKLVIEDDEKTSNYQTNPTTFIPRPSLPQCKDVFFAKIFNEDGTEADEYDVFFVTIPAVMRDYCLKNNLDFPLPDSRLGDYIWIYGLVYDKTSLEIKQVKAYIKYTTDPSDPAFTAFTEFNKTWNSTPSE